MGFLDEVVITAKGGDGGRGCASFRRERFRPKGGPDGGDGGGGGNVLLKATGQKDSLSDYSSKRYFRAANGEPGKGKNKSGKDGPDTVLEVPLGTAAEDLNTGEIIADLVHEGQEFLLAPGGKGGRGNQHFSTPTRRAPKYAQSGLPGSEIKIRLCLRFIAHVGLIGLPNAGKSSLLSRLSRAHPRIDSYPFTTLSPNLGQILADEETSLVIADIPGLIEGASRGVGLGHRFLKHVERTRLLLHILDITYPVNDDILEDFSVLRREIEAYGPLVADKEYLVVINKMDIYGPGHRDVEAVQRALNEMGIESLAVSAETGEGLEELKALILKRWKAMNVDCDKDKEIYPWGSSVFSEDRGCQ